MKIKIQKETQDRLWLMRITEVSVDEVRGLSAEQQIEKLQETLMKARQTSWDDLLQNWEDGKFKNGVNSET